MALFHLARANLPEKQQRLLDPNVAMARARAATFASLDASSDQEIRRTGGYSRKRATRALETIFAASFFEDGRTMRTPPITESEKSLLDRFARTLTVQAFFEPRPLAMEFFRCLAANGLLDADDTPSDLCVHRLSAFAISKLHLAEIVLDTGEISRLEASYDPHSPRKYVSVTSRLEGIIADSTVAISFPAFKSQLPLEEWCEEELRLINEWKFSVEVNDNWRLAMV